MSFTVYNSGNFSDISSNNIRGNTLDVTNINTSSITGSNIVETQPLNPSSNSPQVNLFSIDTIQKYGLGSRYSYNGCIYRYCKIENNPSFGAATFQSHNLVSSEELNISNTRVLLTGAATLNNTYTITVTLDSDVVADYFKNFYIYVIEANVAQDNLIVSHPAGLNGQKIQLTVLYPTQSAPTGIDVGLRKNPWVIAPSTVNQVPIGVMLYSVATGITGYVWIQTYGLASILQTSNTGVASNLLTVGLAVVPGKGGGTGRVMAPRTDTAADCNLPIIGTCVIDPPGFGDNALVFLTISN